MGCYLFLCAVSDGTRLHTPAQGGNLFRPGTKPWSHRFESTGLSARRCQCPSPKTERPRMFEERAEWACDPIPDSITEKWPLTTDRYPSSIRK